MASFLKAKVAEHLRELRLKHTLTQRQLAKDTNIGQGTISDWERGVSWIQPHHIEQLMERYGMEPGELLFGNSK